MIFVILASFFMNFYRILSKYLNFFRADKSIFGFQFSDHALDPFRPNLPSIWRNIDDRRLAVVVPRIYWASMSQSSNVLLVGELTASSASITLSQGVRRKQKCENSYKPQLMPICPTTFFKKS